MGVSLRTESNLSYKITHATKLKLGGQIEGDYFNLSTYINKDSDWHAQEKEIISDIVKKNQNKPTAVAISGEDNADLLNWNMGNNNTIFMLIQSKPMNQSFLRLGRLS